MVELPDGARVSDLKARLRQDFPGLAEAMDFALISINREFAFDEDKSEEGLLYPSYILPLLDFI